MEGSIILFCLCGSDVFAFFFLWGYCCDNGESVDDVDGGFQKIIE